MPRISLIIPAYNEEQYLPASLASVDTARPRYIDGPGEIEVIVADNASTDATAAVASEHGCRVIRVAKRSIAAARNGGACAADGEILAFVDADSLIHPDTFNAITRTIASQRVIVGATGIRFSRGSIGIYASSAVLWLMSRLGGADAGVIFCKRADWEAVGGYSEDRQFAEDVQFLFKLKREGRRRNQRFARPRGVRTISSARKFDRHGDWHWFAILARGIGWFLFDREKIRQFARAYWYDDAR